MTEERRTTSKTVMFQSGLLVPAKIQLTANNDISRGKWSGHFNLSTNQLGPFPRNKIKCLCKYKYKRMIRLAVDAVDKQHMSERVRIRVPDGAIGSTKLIVISGNEWAEVQLVKETEERLLGSERKQEVEESNEDNQQDKNDWNRPNSYERRPLFCGFVENDPCQTTDVKSSTGLKRPSPMQRDTPAISGLRNQNDGIKAPPTAGDRPLIARESVVDEKKRTPKKMTTCNEHSLSQTRQMPTRPTRQKKTISFPVKHTTYIPPCRQHTQASNTKNVLTKVPARGILKGGGGQAPRSVPLNPPIRENITPVKREEPCASNVEESGESAWKKPGARQTEVKGDPSVNFTPINRFRDRFLNVTIPRKPEQKNESPIAPDTAIGKAVNKPSTPNVGCNLSETRATQSARLSGARTSITPVKPCERKITGYSLENLTKACIENPSSVLKPNRLLPDLMLRGRLQSEGVVVNAVAQMSPCLAVDASRVPVCGISDGIIFTHDFPKIVSDYLKGVGYTQIIAATMGNAAKQKTASFVETLCTLVHPVVTDELKIYGKLYCTLGEKKSIIERVIKRFNECVRNSEQWKSIRCEENEIQC